VNQRLVLYYGSAAPQVGNDFALVMDLPSSHPDSYVTSGDFNGDGLVDLAVADSGVQGAANTCAVYVFFDIVHKPPNLAKPDSRLRADRWISISARFRLRRDSI